MSKIDLSKIKADWEKAIAKLGTTRERNVIGKLIKALLDLVGTDWKAVDVTVLKPYDLVGNKEEMTIEVIFQRRKP